MKRDGRSVVIGAVVVALGAATRFSTGLAEAPPARVPGDDLPSPRRVPAAAMQPETLPTPPPFDAELPLPRGAVPPLAQPGTPKPAAMSAEQESPAPPALEPPRREGIPLPRAEIESQAELAVDPKSGDVLELVTAIRQETSAARLAAQAEPIARLLSDTQFLKLDVGDWSLDETIEAIWTAANLRASAARVAGRSDGGQSALVELEQRLADLGRRLKALADASAAETWGVTLVACHRHRAAAILARSRGDRPAQIAAWSRARAESESLVAAHEMRFSAGVARLSAVAEAARFRCEAAAALAAVSTTDPARMRDLRIAALESYGRLLGALRETADKATETGLGPPEDAPLAGFLAARCAALLARQRQDRTAEAAAWLDAVARAGALWRIVESQDALLIRPPAVVLDASKYLQQARFEQARSAADTAGPARARRDAFDSHLAVAEKVLDQSAARFRAGVASTSALAYPAARYLWIRLQIAEIGYAAGAADDPVYSARGPGGVRAEVVPTPAPEPAIAPAAAGWSARPWPPCPVIVPACP